MREDTTRSRPFAKSLRTRLTEPETILWSQLRTWREQGHSFRRQHPIGPYIADFACIGTKIVIELDGDQHGSEENRIHDQRRDAYMTERGWRVVRISNDRIYNELSDVLNMLAELLPPPPRKLGTSPAIRPSSGEGTSTPQGRKEGSL